MRWPLRTSGVHHRVATRFRQGPVFLLGDAAHIHSPVALADPLQHPARLERYLDSHGLRFAARRARTGEASLPRV